MGAGGGSWERELNYYRRECNDLGARLLRLQEEQSQTFREARRSRTVVKLLRETYRLGDFASTTQDVGGAMLELVVDNAMCDRAALLREEPPASGRFLIAHAIGLAESALASVVEVQRPPPFLYSSGQGDPPHCAEQIAEALGVPYVLWAYDEGSGHALAIGNRFETNVSRPFEPGDQELIESALSIYLDVLYRKHAEALLRQAKQAAEAARDARAAFLVELAREVREPIQAVIDLCERQRDGAFVANPTTIQDISDEMIQLAAFVQSLVDEAADREAEPSTPPAAVLDQEWVAVEELIRGALRTIYTASIKSRIELDCRLPHRRTAILIDRARFGRAVQTLVLSAVAATPTGGTMRVACSRRSDGGLEILFSSRGAGPLAVAHPAPELSLDVGDMRGLGNSPEPPRRTVEAHQGILTTETSAFSGTNMRLILPPQRTRDVDIFRLDAD